MHGHGTQLLAISCIRRDHVSDVWNENSVCDVGLCTTQQDRFVCTFAVRCFRQFSRVNWIRGRAGKIGGNEDPFLLLFWFRDTRVIAISRCVRPQNLSLENVF